MRGRSVRCRHSGFDLGWGPKFRSITYDRSSQISRDFARPLAWSSDKHLFCSLQVCRIPANTAIVCLQAWALSVGRRYLGLFTSPRNLAHGFPEFESSEPSQAVQSPRCDLRGGEQSTFRASPSGRLRRARTQTSHIDSCKRFAAFLKRSPDTATPVALATVWRRIRIITCDVMLCLRSLWIVECHFCELGLADV